MKQRELAQRLGVDRATVSTWERDIHRPERYLGALEAELRMKFDGIAPPIDPRVQRMVEDLTDEERDWVISQLTGHPLPEGGAGRRERGAG